MEDPEKVLMSAGITDGSAKISIEPAPKDYMCPICCTEARDSPNMKVACMSCNHSYCLDCYSRFISQKIVDDGEAVRIKCPAHKCPTILDPHSIQMLVDKEVYDKYQRLFIKSWVDENEYLKFCPSANCENVVECHVKRSEMHQIIPTVACKCGTRFCFGYAQILNCTHSDSLLF